MILQKISVVLMALWVAGPSAYAQDTVTTTTTEESESSGLKRGGFMIEPILSFTREESTIKTSQLPIVADDTSGSMEGFGAGARLGAHVSEMIFLGADGRYSRMTLDDSFYQSASGDMFTLGPSLALQMPRFGLRLLGTYILAGQFNPEAGVQGLDVKFTQARGYRVGAGLRLASFSVNLEYQDLTFDNTDIESVGSLTADTTTDVDFSNSGYTLSLSFPVEL